MPGLPTTEEVLQAVTTNVAGFTQMDVAKIKPDMVLKNPPLRFDDNKLTFFATTLRGYTKSFNEDATIRAADTKKSQQTVKGIASVVYDRIRGK